MPIDGTFNHAQILVQCFHDGASVDAARWLLPGLLSQSLAMRTHLFESATVVQAQIPFTTNLIASDIIKSADQNTRRQINRRAIVASFRD
jgi:hypothetical protein